MNNGLHILSTGRAVPPRVVTNDDMSRIVDTNDEWIQTRTGISERHFCGEGESVTTLAIEAARIALERSGIDKDRLGVLIVATFAPETAAPSTACMVQRALELPENMPCFDMNAAYSGFLYGLHVLRSLLLQSDRPYGLLVASEALSKVTNFADRGTCVLFGDGAGAVVAELRPEKPYGCVLGAGGDMAITCGGPGSQDRLIRMAGNAVFRFAVERIPQCMDQVLQKTGLTMEQIDHVVCHQANARIIRHVERKLKPLQGKFYLNIQRYGNTSAASIPLCLDEMAETGLLKRGDRVLLTGFGAGFTWGAAVLEW